MTAPWTLQPPLPVLDGFLPAEPFQWLPWDWSRVRERSEREMFPHQVTGSQYLLENWGGALFMGMRTGKSLTLVDAIVRGGIFPHLIICPVSVMATWENELLQEGLLPREIHLVHEGGRDSQLTRPGVLVSVVNFEVVKKCHALRIRDGLGAALEIPRWAGVSVDESYRIANPEAQITREILRTPRPAGQFRAILSGAPASESGLNLASQFMFLDGEFFGRTSLMEYTRDYCRQDPRTRRWVPTRRGHLQEIKDLVNRRAYCLQMSDLDLGVEKVHQVWQVDPNKAQEEALQWCKLANTYPAMKDGKKITRLMSPLVRSTFLAKAAAGLHPLTGEVISTGKAQLLLDWLQDHPEESALVLSRFTAPIKATRELLERAGIRVEVITGETPKKDREAIRRAFQAGEVRVVIGQVRTVKMGLDFSRSNYLFYLSNSYSQDDRTQSEERGNHTKKTGILQIIDIVTRDSNERKLVTLLTSKKKLSQSYIRETMSKWAAELSSQEEPAEA